MNWCCPECDTVNDNKIDDLINQYVGCDGCDNLFQVTLDKENKIESIHNAEELIVHIPVKSANFNDDCGGTMTLDLENSYRIIMGKKYLIIRDSEFEQGENEADTEFMNKISEIYTKSTHWFCKETSIENNITKGRTYSFFRDEKDGEFVILDNNGNLSMAWLFIDGDLMVEENI